ncbi:restriction endonuclease subunit S [Stutzerimonas zhaodongensis]|uniref:Restriction endonuclease subunit S n=1 Tax=Stutzerimonas zhaodongensis TaxID=1176257 RepID=A0ABX8IZ87_9GAMM|nr:restriction endonuclease subunit S [Stutzerimonas zhaodongensis]QWV18123.1 restriction endonuclease subunit S [Stutzerimonas zhaodongensis]
MSEWAESPLAQLATFQKGRKVETTPFDGVGYAPYLGASGLEGGDDGYAATRLAVIAKSTDTLMLWDGERSGLVGYGRKGVVASTVSKLSPTDKIEPKYLYYALSDRFDWIQHRRTGTGVPHVPKDLGRLLKLRYPKQRAVQRRIASILTGIDTAIEKTEALIAKYLQIKAGLMHDLFIRGVLPNGQLRPPREQAPELYQETAIGWIPREWNVSTLEDLLAPLPNNIRSGPFGSALLKHELVEDGIPFLGIDNIHTEHFEPEFRRFVSERKFLELAKYKVRPRDVVITIMGTVGRCCVIPDDLDLALSSKHLWTMTFDSEKVLPELVCWKLNFSSWTLAWFRRAMQGGIMDAIQSSTLKTLQLPVPGIEEQALIHERYLKISTRIRQERELLKKLRKQKSGLMRDLLTGKVSVKVEEPEAVDG